MDGSTPPENQVAFRPRHWVKSAMSTLMLEEAVSAASCVTLQLGRDTELYAKLGRRLREADPATALTIAATKSTPSPRTRTTRRR